MKSKTFPIGGVHPADNKLSANVEIQTLPLPEEVHIPVAQHIGAPAEILVKKGDAVKVGTIIAKSAGFISANIHSSVSGVISKIDDLVDSSGYKKKVISIKVDGDEWDDNISNKIINDSEVSVSKDELIEVVNNAGIVGLGGATFPSHVKLMVPNGKKADVLIINGVECEPFLTSDHQLMLEHAKEIISGVSLILKIMEIPKAIIGIENNKQDAIEFLTKESVDLENIEVQPLKVKYPQGGEKQLIKATINREIGVGKLPIDVGAIVLNVGTIYAIHQALTKKMPLVQRVVTITGKQVKKPLNLIVRIGTPVSHLLNYAEVNLSNVGKIINGGPMMGKALTNVDSPVTKGTSGILVLDKSEAKRKTESSCIRCGKCISACAFGLEPYLLKTLTSKYMWDRLEKEKVMACCDCGSCSFTCPANIPLLDYIKVGKYEVGKILRSRKNN